MRFRFLAFTLIALAVNPPVFGQSLAKTFTLKAASQNACIGTGGLPTVGIVLSGTASLTLQPQVSINGSTPQDSSVTSTVAGSQPAATIILSGSSNGSFVAPVGGFDTFCLNVSAYTSGSITVVLNPSPAINARLGGGSTPSGVVSVSGTAPVVSSGGANPAISISGVTGEQGNGAKLQLSTGTVTQYFLAEFDANGNTVNSQTFDDLVDPQKSPNGYDAGMAGAYSSEIANNTGAGTTVNALACNDGAGKVIVCPAVSSTTNAPIGTVIGNAGSSGNAIVAYLGFILNCFDNQSVVLDWAVESTTANGCLHDTGNTFQTPGQPNYLVWTANAGANTNGYYRLLTADDFQAAAAGVQITVNGGSPLGSPVNFQNGTGTTVTNPSGNNIQVNLVPVPIAVTVTADPAPTTANNGEFYQLNYSGAGNFTLPASIPAAQWAVVTSNISASTVTIQGNGNNVCSLTCAGTLSLPAGAQFYIASSSGQYVASVLTSGTLSGTTNRLTKFTSATGAGNTAASEANSSSPIVDPNGYDASTTGAYSNDIANNAATGTTVNALACDDGAGKVIVCPHASSTTNAPIGTVIAGAGKAANATVAFLGFILNCYDNQSVVKNWAIASTSSDGCLHDTGSASQTAGQPNYLTWTANAGANTAGYYRLLTADDFAAAGCTGTCATQSGVQNQAYTYHAGAGTANAQTVALSPAITALATGQYACWLPSHANASTTPTLAVNGLTAKTIVKANGAALAASDLITTQIACAIYDGTNYELQNPATGGGGGSATATVNVQFDKCVPAQSTNAGNSFFYVTPYTNYDLGTWQFVLNTQADIYCLVRVPHNLSGTTGSIILDLAANDAASGHTAGFTTCDVITTSANLNATTCSAAGSQNFTTTSTAYANTELTFAVQSTLAADQYLIVRIRQAASSSVTANINMPPPILQIVESF